MFYIKTGKIYKLLLEKKYKSEKIVEKMPLFEIEFALHIVVAFLSSRQDESLHKIRMF